MKNRKSLFVLLIIVSSLSQLFSDSLDLRAMRYLKDRAIPCGIPLTIDSGNAAVRRFGKMAATRARGYLNEYALVVFGELVHEELAEVLLDGTRHTADLVSHPVEYYFTGLVFIDHDFHTAAIEYLWLSVEYPDLEADKMMHNLHDFAEFRGLEFDSYRAVAEFRFLAAARLNRLMQRFDRLGLKPDDTLLQSLKQHVYYPSEKTWTELVSAVQYWDPSPQLKSELILKTFSLLSSGFAEKLLVSYYKAIDFDTSYDPAVLLDSEIKQKEPIIESTDEETGKAREWFIEELFYAVMAQDLERSNDLISAGAPLDGVYYDNTPLSLAVSLGNWELSESFLSLGADPDQILYDGETALFYSVLSNYTELSDLLISYGADVNWQNDIGVTPLMTAAMMSFYEQAVLLIANGADVNMETIFGFTAYDYAINNQAEDLADYLSERMQH